MLDNSLCRLNLWRCALKATAIFAVALASVAVAQSPLRPPQFEVASIKPSAPDAVDGGMYGGPGTKDPALFSCENTDLTSLVVAAYDIPRYRFSGPAWMRSTRFSVSAKVPDGTTKEQFKLMQQALLAERFRLTFHWEKKDLRGYNLVVAKDGPKLTSSSNGPAPKDPDAPPPQGPFKNDKDGFPIIPPDDHRRNLFAMDGARAVQLFFGRSMEHLAAYCPILWGGPSSMRPA